MVTRGYDDERALLAALGHRHAATLPLTASICLSAAVDELTDPLRLPALIAFDAAAPSDPDAVMKAVQDRLAEMARTADSVDTALRCARAARELRRALQCLRGEDAGEGQ
jgi:hypothetical protein